MINEKSISDHYIHGDLLNAIQSPIAKPGKTVDSVTIEDLGPVDEFHIGGRVATKNYIAPVEIIAQKKIKSKKVSWKTVKINLK